MKKAWDKLINIGVKDDSNSRLNEYIRSINFITLVWIPVLLLLATLCAQNPNSNYNPITFVTILFMVAIFLLIKSPIFSAIAFLFVVNFNLVMINVMLEFNYGTFLFLFPLFASVPYIFPLPKYKVNLALTITLMVVVHLTTFIVTVEFPSSNFRKLDHTYFTIINYTLAFLLTFTFIIQYSLSQAKQKMILDRTIKQNIKQRLLLEETLKDKNILLSEIHHRTKNNLAIVSSILNLQRSQVHDEQLDSILLDCSNRVHSIAAVHQKLYEKGDFSIVDFKEYMGGLITDLQRTLFPKDKTITVFTDIESFDIKTDQAVSCALILNEVITNSIKYAFNTDSTDNRIEIRVSQISHQILLMIHDNGPGFNVKELNQNSSSLGMSLIEALTEQLDGIYEYHNVGGTTFTLTFKLE